MWVYIMVDSPHFSVSNISVINRSLFSLRDKSRRVSSFITLLKKGRQWEKRTKDRGNRGQNVINLCVFLAFKKKLKPWCIMYERVWKRWRGTVSVQRFPSWFVSSFWAGIASDVSKNTVKSFVLWAAIKRHTLVCTYTHSLTHTHSYSIYGKLCYLLRCF